MASLHLVGSFRPSPQAYEVTGTLATRGSKTQGWGMHSPMLVLVSAAVLSSLSCAAARGPAAGEPEVALRRGSAWATYSVELPRITGPTANLRLEDGRLRGMLASRSLDVKIEEDGATGFGPGGPVNLSILREGPETHVQGMWNGAPVNLLFAPSTLKGSVVIWQGRLAAQQASCGYNLTKVEPNGALSGTSTCVGMPQQTRLEVQAGTAGALTNNELVVLLVAALSSPPFSPNERTL